LARIFYECRDVAAPSGGVRRLYRHVEILNQKGFEAYILHHEQGFRVQWFTSPAPVRYWDEMPRLNREDVLVIPEGHTDVMSATVRAPFARVVIALNWANIYPKLPVGRDWRHLGLRHVIAGSEYEREFISRSMGLDSIVIVSGTNGDMFRPADRKKCRIMYMPRKNPHVFHLIACVFRSRFPELAQVPFVAIDRVEHREVARMLSEAAVFLATSFPEGLARPPLEAMACGCLVVGFAGRGSLEYMRHLQNCFLAEDMDVLSAADHLGTAVKSFLAGRAGAMQEAGRQTALRYSLEREERAVAEYWGRFVDCLEDQRGFEKTVAAV
jgi:hypothetical protein